MELCNFFSQIRFCFILILRKHRCMSHALLITFPRVYDTYILFPLVVKPQPNTCLNIKHLNNVDVHNCQTDDDGLSELHYLHTGIRFAINILFHC